MKRQMEQFSDRRKGMIQIIFTCDRCKRQRELKKDFGEEDELYDVVIGRHNGFTLNRAVKPTMLCPECKSELEKWLNGSLDK